MLDIGKDYVNLPEILGMYDKELDEAADRIRISGKGLGRANLENSEWYHYYANKRSELLALVKYMKMQVLATRSKLYVSYTQTHDRDLTEAGKKIYIDNEPAYMEKQELLITLEEVCDKFEDVCKAFTQRGYSLNNLTKISVAQLEDLSL